jgi:predicted nucleotidyltransferase
MILEKDFEDFLALLNRRKVEYMVVGGYALALHGKPRHTGDLDIWINMSEKNALKLLAVFKDFGMSALDFKKQDFLEPGYITQVGYPPLRIDILNSIDGIAFEKAVAGMQRIQLEDDLYVNFIGLAEFLKNKQAAGRKQDLADIKEIKKLQSAGKLKTGKKRN